MWSYRAHRGAFDAYLLDYGDDEGRDFGARRKAGALQIWGEDLLRSDILRKGKWTQKWDGAMALGRRSRVSIGSTLD